MANRLGALLQAVCLYMFFYALAVHYFVALKWQTTEIEDLTPIKHINLPLPEVHQPLEGVPSASTVQRLLRDLNESQSEDPIPSRKVEKILDNYTAVLKNFEYWNGDSIITADDDSPLLPDGRKTIKTVSLVKLLKKYALSELEDEKSFNSSLHVVMRELKGLSEHRIDLNWDVIGDLLIQQDEDASFPDKLKLTKEEIYNESCVLEPAEDDDSDEDSDEEGEEEEEEDLPKVVDEEEDGEDEEDGDTSHLLDEDDLETHYQVIEAVLGQRNESLQDYLRLKINHTVSAAFGDAIAILDQELQDAKAFTDESLEGTKTRLEQILQENMAAAETIDEVECVAVSDVIVLIEAGLGALQTRKDLRATLLNTLKHLDSSVAEGLILDADLETEAPIPEGSAKSLNLQRMIDKPMLRQLFAGVDFLLEKASEYTDELKPRIDKLCEHLSPGALKKGVSPAETLMVYMLQLAGHAKVPIPQEVRQVLSQSPKGRILLADLF